MQISYYKYYLEENDQKYLFDLSSIVKTFVSLTDSSFKSIKLDNDEFVFAYPMPNVIPHTRTC